VGKLKMGPSKGPKARQAEEEEEHEQKHEHLKGHKILAAGNEEHRELPYKKEG
jgi:hypothetical protein